MTYNNSNSSVSTVRRVMYVQDTQNKTSNKLPNKKQKQNLLSLILPMLVVFRLGRDLLALDESAVTVRHLRYVARGAET